MRGNDERETAAGTAPIAECPDVDETIVSLDPAKGISDQLRRRLLLLRFWQSAAGRGGAGGRGSWLLTGTILLLILNLAASYGMNIWNRAIFDALEQRDATTVFFLSMVYFRYWRQVFAWSLPRSTPA